jgi:hypothetical protein
MRTCREFSDDSKPCRFAVKCNAARQDYHSSFNTPMWGNRCGFFLLLVAPVSEKDAERSSIQAETSV